MGILRIVAWVLVGLGIALIGADGVSTLEMDVAVIRSTAEVLTLIGLNPSFAEGGALAGVANVLLSIPLWALLGGVGLVLVMVLRPVD